LVLTLPIDFELAGTYGFVDFDGGVGSVIANPNPTGINTSAKVGKIVRNGGATWAGSKLRLPNRFDFSTTHTFTMKVYSTRVGLPVLFKLEGTGATEVLTRTTVANGWEELRWNFSGRPANTYNELVFMFDFGTVGNGSASSTFLFDDVNLTTGASNTNEIAGSTITIFPNPANDRLFIGGLVEKSVISIYDFSGKRIFNAPMDNNEMDISLFPNGIYSMKIEMATEIVLKKFVKQ
jgi:hypothetical protein